MDTESGLPPELLWALAERLYYRMEQLDPGYPGDGRPEVEWEQLWGALRDCDREIWYLSVDHLFFEAGQLGIIVQPPSGGIKKPSP